MFPISNFHYLTQDISDYTHVQLAEQACRGGARWIQLRIKSLNEKDWLLVASQVQEVCKKYEAAFIINDNVKIAKTIGADGVHLGKNDLPIHEARKFLGSNFIIGGTANSLEDVKKRIAEQVDYIGLGPYRFTDTKKNLSPVLGSQGLTSILSKIESDIPIIAIGGIRLADIKKIKSTGIYGLAISSAINLSGDIKKATHQFIKQIYAATEDSR